MTSATPASDFGSRLSFGPLTTTFAPPESCATATWVSYGTGDALLAWGAVCVQETGSTARAWNWASACYPPEIRGVFTGAGLNNIFSPGLGCPDGWTGNFTTTAGQRNPSDIYNIGFAQATVSGSQTGTVCCPSGYGYTSAGCVSYATSVSARRLLTTDASGCIRTTIPEFTGAIKTGDSKRDEKRVNKETTSSEITATFTAYPIILVNGGVNSPSSSALSTGAKIAIGVCIPVGILIIAAALFIWWHRRKKTRRAAVAAPEVPVTSDDVSKKTDEAPAGFVKPELDNGDPLYQKPELDTGAPVVQGTAPVEMSNDQSISELPAVQSPTTPQAELPGDFLPISGKMDAQGDSASASLSKSIRTIVVDSPTSPGATK